MSSSTRSVQPEVIFHCPSCKLEVGKLTPLTPMRAILTCPDPKCGRQFTLVVAHSNGLEFKQTLVVKTGFTPKQEARNTARAPQVGGLPADDQARLDKLTLAELDVYVEARAGFYHGMAAFFEEQVDRLKSYRSSRYNVALSKHAARQDALYAEQLREKEALARAAAREKAGIETDTVKGKERQPRKDAPPLKLDAFRTTLLASLDAFAGAGLVPAEEAKKLRSECNSLAGLDRLAKRLGMPQLAQSR